LKADFMLNRLMRMSVPEILYRLQLQYLGIKDQGKAGKNVFMAQVIDVPETLFNENLALPVSADLIKEADMICKNRLTIFTLEDHYLGDTINFHKDYKNNITAPSDSYSKLIDYRDASKIGDIKYTWELNRHLYLTKLAVAYRVTGRKKYIDKINNILIEWINQNPFMLGINWTSALELGIRLINWTFCVHLLNDNLNEFTFKKLINSVYQHCWFISKYFSLYSSANNHLIGEASGLFIASTALPRFKESAGWQNLAYKILLREAIQQNYPDGVNKEQAIAYQQFVFDLLLLPALIGRRYDIHFPDEYWNTMEQMCEYLAAIENVAGIIPQIGDGDEGFIIDLGQKNIGAHRSILNTASFLFGREQFARKAKKADLKTALIMNIAQFKPKNRPPGMEAPLAENFIHGGYFIFNHNSGSSKEQKLIFDCGSLGYLSIAAHGHADALSFNYSAGGHPIFIDPGTYAYHTNKKWRNYFRSTRAHNTLCLDRADQSVMSGNFMWSRKANVTVKGFHNGFWIIGMHDGYKRFGIRGMIHEREIKYNYAHNTWHIKDKLIGKGKHSAEVYFHLDPSCAINKKLDHMLEISFPGGLCSLFFDPDLNCKVFNGNSKLPLGWYSPAYDVKYPTNTIVLKKTINGNSVINTWFNVQFA